jgi:hypothetical protein
MKYFLNIYDIFQIEIFHLKIFPKYLFKIFHKYLRNKLISQIFLIKFPKYF